MPPKGFIAKVEEQKLLIQKRKIMYEDITRHNDSVKKIREAKREAYLDEQREAQKKNR